MVNFKKILQTRRYWSFKKKLLALVFLQISLVLSAQVLPGDILSGEFVYSFGASLPAEDNDLSDQEVINFLLEEARFAFSGMIYGFRVEYRPSDLSRQIPEIFTITPLAQIPFGDPFFSVYQVWNDDNEFHAHIQYQLQDFQLSRIESYNSNTVPESFGQGSATVLGGYNQRIEAIKQAVKNAFVNYLKDQTRNKPERGIAEVFLVDAPRVFLTSFEYQASVKIKINLLSLDSYQVF